MTSPPSDAPSPHADSDNVLLTLHADLTIASTDGGWVRTARSAGFADAPLDIIGRPILSLFAPPVRAFFRALFERVLETREPAHHDYLCPTPTTRRSFRLRVTPVGGGLMCSHHLIAEEPARDAGVDASEGELRARYTNPDGMIIQCCHCRMTRRPDAPHTWDWVPRFIEVQPDNLSHGLCQACFRIHYPLLALKWDAGQVRAGREER